MKPIEQLKETNVTLTLKGSCTEEVYDFCKDYDFVFTLQHSREWYQERGDYFSPDYWERKDTNVLSNLKVFDKENYEELMLPDEELDEIAKELLTKIEIE